MEAKNDHGVTELMGRWRLWLQHQPCSVLARGSARGQAPPGKLRKVEVRSWVLHLDCEDWRHRVLKQEEVTQPPGPKEGMDWLL